MSNITTINNSIEIRSKIVDFETAMRQQYPDYLTEKDFPLRHHFAPGAYGREIFMPAGSLVVGKIHKHAHLNMIMQGRVSVVTEEGTMEYSAPIVLVSKAGTKRVVLVHEDTIWVTVHLTDKTDLVEIEDEIIAKTYEEFDLLEAQKLLVDQKLVELI